jgi:hypothetical protein
MELPAKRVRAETMTAEAIGVDVKFEFLDPVLGRAAVSYHAMRSAARPRRFVTMKRTLRPAAVTSTLTRIRR